LEITPEQCARFSVLAGKTEMSQIESLFCSEDSGVGLQPEEMAMELWEFGYLPAPTVDALLDAMEREMQRREAQNTIRHSH
jgi:hypothetical protein